LDKVLGKMPQKTFKSKRVPTPSLALEVPAGLTVEAALTNGVLRLVSVGSKRFLTSKVDRSVTGLVAQQQCVGPLHTPLANFAAFAQSPLGFSGAATAVGEQPLKGIAGDAAACRSMARLAVAEALTNLMWIKISSLDSVKASGNWMWAAKFEGEGPKMYDAAQALSDVMVELGMAIDGGKDSLSMAARVPLDNGTSEIAKSPGQLVITAYAPVPDVRVKVTPDLKSRGNSALLFVDLGKGATLGGSSLAQVLCQVGAGSPPEVDVAALKVAFEATQRLLSGGLLLAGHDRSDGGLIVTVLEMAFAGRVGFDLKLEASAGGQNLFPTLFGEAPGIVYEVRREDLAAVWRLLDSQGVQAIEIGSTRADMQARVVIGAECVLDADVRTLHDVWEATSFQLERLQCALPCVEEEEAGMKHRTGPKFKLTFAPEPTADSLLLASNKHRLAVVRQEGSNGDREMSASFHMAGFEVWDVHMSDLLEGRITLDAFRGAAFVGGFSYADTLDSAKGWAGSVLFSPALTAQFKMFRDRPETFSIGICNGCQLLALLGWVPGSDEGEHALPLTQQPRFVHNKSGRFESRFVTIRIEQSAASKVWTTGMEGSQLGVWVAHGEGQCHFPDLSVYESVKRNHLVPMRYIDDDGNQTQKYPFNPNGSPDGIVGLCSKDGRHMAVMPHPERVTVWPWQWPYAPQEWLEGPSRLKSSPWLRMFQNAHTWCGSVDGRSGYP
jgi:phosphoribosylformylglycinamidine synthase